MKLTNMRVLIACNEPETSAALSEHIMTKLDADVTIVDTVEEARVLAASDAFDAVVASDQLSDGTGVSILPEEGGASDIPLLLLTDQLDAQQVLTALRRGAMDVFPTPLDLDRFTAVVQRIARARRERKRQEARARRLQRVSTRLIRDRRELRQRVDLICRDLVYAYRRLAEKVIASQSSETAPQPPSHMDAYDPES